VPFVDRDLAGEDGRASPVTFLEDLVEVTTAVAVEGFEAPIVEDEELDAGETAQNAGIAAITAGERELGQELGNPLIENRAVVAAGLVTQGTSKPRFAHAGRPAQNQIVVRVVTQLDFTGPLQVLSRRPQSATHIVAKSESPVSSDCGLGLVPTHTFANCPSLDLLCVPGGSYGVVRAIGDRETMEFVRRQAGAAKYVTSVCFWINTQQEASGRRMQRIKEGGRHGSSDFGLTVAAEIERAAQTVQLGIEYDPEPPFDSGHPDRAPVAIKSALLSGRYEEARLAFRAGIDKASRL
jgi:cyclohexyl-isocyanide hydratase